jgi:elongation factor P--(R)-beta-lysine ligase
MSNWSDLKNNPRLKAIYDIRIKIIRLIREFFWSQGFVETDTPVALRFPSQEPHLNFVPVTIHDPRNAMQKMYLRTSPEFALKKLLAAGYEKIFEIGKCFRDYESFGGNHNTEFTMLEWYRVPGAYRDFMDDMEKMFKYIGRKLEIKKLRNRKIEIDFDCQWDRLSMKEVWQKYVGVDLDDCLEIEKLRKLAEYKKYKIDDSDAYEDVFYKIFLNEIEPKLGLERPVFIYDYPAQMASLSCLCEHDQRYAERAECYIGGLELCNGFGELTDADEQKKRLEKDRQLRSKLGKEVWPVDPDFIAALAGLPAKALAQAGIALGVDRMVLLFTGAKDINEAIFQSVKDQADL